MPYPLCRSRFVVLLTVLTILAVSPAPAASQSFVNFESGHVRPLALSPDGSRLFAVNTPDNRLTIYDVTPAGLTLAGEVSVGLEPVAAVSRTNLAGRTEVWVVNHLSDSVSVVEIHPSDVALSRVTTTLLVGDEPRDIVFAGSAGNRAFITAAHRGQNRPGDPQLTTEGVGRADIWAFNADSLGAPLGGTPLAIIQAFGDTPRALAKSPDGATVYAAVFHSGNQTTTVLEQVVTANGGLPTPPPGSTPGAPRTGLIVKFDGAAWLDEDDTDWGGFVNFALPDKDVFLINADANPPALTAGTNAVSGVGTILFNMAVRPGSGAVFVGNTEARNEVRFEPVLTGHLAESRITVIQGTTPTSVHLNSHIDYGVIPGPPAEVEQSLAFPTDMVFSSDGATLYVAALGSGKVGVYDAGDLEGGIVTVDLVEVGGGPSGLALDEVNDRLYVMNRFDHTISIVSNASDESLRGETAVVPLRYDPSPPAAKNGRRFLYDARATSAHGDAACASCHIFGDFDSLAWDLGDPFGASVPNPNPFRVGSGGPFHPMKGPMTTQSLRGMAGLGPMHWRGDRSGGTDGGDPFDEDLAFKEFNPAFVGLLGRGSELTPSEMQAFTDFILSVRYPPNPIRALDNFPTASELSGENFFRNTPTDAGAITCDFCHRLPFGGDGRSSVEGEPQEFKIPHLRNMYQKVGMFGLPGQPDTGDQVRGFGYLHDGGVDTLFTFVNGMVFQNLTPQLRRDLEAFMLALDTGLRPAVGQQVSLTPASVNDPDVKDRVDLLIARDDAGDCELTVKGNVNGQARGFVYLTGNTFDSDRDTTPLISKATLLGFAATVGQEQVFTCVPPGSGQRIGIDRDTDGFGDRTELDAGSNPADPTSVPGGPALVLTQTTALKMRDATTPPNPEKRKLTFKANTKKDGPDNQILPPGATGPGDPTGNGSSGGGALLTVYNSNGSGEAVSVPLPASGWEVRVTGGGIAYRYRGATGDAIDKVDVKTNQIKVRGGKGAWLYTLDETSQGSVALQLRLGTGVIFCANAPAKVSGSPPSTAASDRVDKFQAEPKSPPPVTCPATP